MEKIKIHKITNKKRIDEIDILKAIGIICMVAGHSGGGYVHEIYLSISYGNIFYCIGFLF